MNLIFEKLMTKAMDFGASDAKIISIDRIPVEDDIVDWCKKPLCESYGKSFYCPPHAMKPERFRELLSDYHKAVVFKIDVLSEILLSEKRFDEFKKIYDIATRLEGYSIASGFSESKGFGAGSCKPVFCHECPCQLLTDQKTCRFPDQARPSLEAVGINVFKLVRDIGWDIRKITENTDPKAVPNGILVGMVLVG